MWTAERPIRTIWTRPKQTISLIVSEDPEYAVFALTVFSGISMAFIDVLSRAKERELPIIAALLIIVVAGPVRGFFSLYIGGWLLSLVGRWFGGCASAGELRAAIAWSNAPVAVGCLGWLLLLAVFGEELFQREFAELQDSVALAYLIGGVLVAEAILICWGYLILALCLATVQCFSLWKSVASMGATALILWIPFGGFAGVFLLLKSAASGS